MSRISKEVHAWMRAGRTEQAKRLRHSYNRNDTLSDHQIAEAEHAIAREAMAIHPHTAANLETTLATLEQTPPPPTQLPSAVSREEAERNFFAMTEGSRLSPSATIATPPPADTVLCQVCGNETAEPTWRPDVTGHANAGNVCPKCLTKALANGLEAQVNAWIEGHKETSTFARSLDNWMRTKGSLTAGQFAAVARILEKDAEKAVTPQIADDKPTVQVDKLMAAFETATKSGLRRPVLRFEHFQASLAPANGRNPGAVYIKADDVYMGKIVNGKFATQPDCSPELVAAVQNAMQDPLAEAVMYGKRTGQCSCCGRTLTDPVSIENGIGPICQERFGM